MFDLVFMKFGKLKSLHQQNEKIDLHKTLVFHCLRHSLCYGANIVFKILFWIFDSRDQVEIWEKSITVFLMFGHCNDKRERQRESERVWFRGRA